MIYVSDKILWIRGGKVERVGTPKDFDAGTLGQ
jgi:hypothetical protein